MNSTVTYNHHLVATHREWFYEVCKTLKFKPGCAEPGMTTLFPFIRMRAASGTTVICKECEEGHQMCEKEGEGYNMCWGGKRRVFELWVGRGRVSDLCLKKEEGYQICKEEKEVHVLEICDKERKVGRVRNGT